MTIFQRLVSVRVPAMVLAAVASCALPANAQEQRGVVFGHLGGASIGYADSEQGNAPILGGGVAFHVTPRLIVEGDVHTARLTNVFGRDHHDFSQVTFTGSVLFRSSPDAAAHLVAGGGLGVQRAHSDFIVDPVGRVERTETLRLLHGRVGAEWDLSQRLMLRAEGVIWFGDGLDWVTGARAVIGYRF